MIRVALPVHLRQLARVEREVVVDVPDPVTIHSVLDELEVRYPVLRGTIRDHISKQRRPFIRFFACGEDLTHEPEDQLLPGPVIAGTEPLRVVGAMAGG